MGGCAKHLQGTWTDQRQGELLREITLNTMVRINTNRSSIPELLRQCAQEGRGHVWHPNKIHSEKAWTCLKMESSATKVWFGKSKKSHVVRGNLLWFSATSFCVFFRNSFQRLCRKVTRPSCLDAGCLWREILSRLTMSCSLYLQCNCNIMPRV